ncbi:g318 [Yersinia phage phiR1-37]|uniref:hypothetical protein n=1 Tax=Yersinia phage phiR1-37 TaxID=331278 RepID=UPI00022DBDE9|nr:hypothetical protein phiR1-37_gp318 [Yersinia phage phiR1-37]CCE26341.1 g318 [Yersinia phage phiR1-37]
MLKVKMDAEDDGKVDHYIGIVHFNDWFHPIEKSVTEENFGFGLKFLSTTDPITFMNDTTFNMKVLLSHAYFNYVGKGNEIRGNRIPYV